MQIIENHPRLASDGNQSLHTAVQTITTQAGWPNNPTLRLKELLKWLQMSRSKAYELMKTDPDFPKSIPLYDSEQSPKFYWTHEAVAWINRRANKFSALQGGH